MINQIYHKTEYRYSNSIFLEPHTIRLSPRTDFFMKLKKKSVLKIHPKPTSISYNIETDGSVSCLANINKSTDHLIIEHTSVIEHHERNPFLFDIYPSFCQKVPFTYPYDMQYILGAYLKISTDSRDLHNFTHYLAEQVDFQTIAFLTNTAEILSKQIQYEYRAEGLPLSPIDTFKSEKGSCRDIAQLFMEICRYMKIATRYVSGYMTKLPETEGTESKEELNPDLHAWVEVYLPGGGWVGVDPTFGVMCSGYHIPLCSSANPELTLPVNGTYRGITNSELITELKITQLKQ